MMSYSELENEIDFNWIDQDFVEYPKAIFGLTASGKTRVSSFLLKKFLDFNPQADVKVIDPHFSEDSIWTVDNSQIIYYQSNFYQEVVSEYEKTIQLLQYRKENGLKVGTANWKESNSQRYYLVNDEFISTLKTVSSFNKKAVDRILKIVSWIDFEGPKYGISFSLVLPHMKKRFIDIDFEGLLGNLNLVYLGSSLQDSNVPLPSIVADQRIETFVEMLKIQHNLDSTKAHICAVLLQNSSRYYERKLEVKAIPHINL